MAPIGLEILRDVTPARWLVRSQDLEVFKDTPCNDAWWSTARPTWKYDKHSAYLACASSVRGGVGEYVYELCPSLIMFLDSQYPAGLWYVQHLDYRVGIADGYDGPGWYYSPLLRLWSQQGAVPILTVGYYWPETVRFLSPFYEALRSLRCENEEACKWLYRRTFGMLAHKPDRTWRGMIYLPDIWNGLRAELKARMYYHAWQVWLKEHQQPVWLHVDELGYGQRVTSLRLGDTPGAFRERCA